MNLSLRRDQAKERVEPVFKPVDSAGFDSGLACIVRAARHHGLHFTVPQLKADHPVPEGARSLLGLREISRGAGLKSEVVEIDFDGLMEFGPALPAILETAQGRFVLMVGINAGSDPQIVLIEDEAAENPTPLPLDRLTLSRIWTGRLLLVKRDFDLKDKAQPFGMRWLLGQLAREQRLFLDVGVAALVMTILNLAPVVFFIIVLNKVFTHNSIATLNVLVVGLMLSIALDTGMGYLRRYVTHFATRRIDARLNIFVYDRILNLPIDYFERTPTGEIVGNIYEVWRIRNFLIGPLFTTALDLMTLVVLVPVMFALAWQLSLIVLLLTALMCAIVIVYLPSVQRRYRKVVEAERAQGSYLIETLHGMRTIKSLALNAAKRRDWDRLVAHAANERFEFGRISNWPMTLSQPVEKLLQVGVVGVGAYIVLAGGSSLDIGILIAFNMLAGRMMAPIVQGVQLINQWEEVRGAIDMVSDVVNREPEHGRAGDGTRPAVQGEIVFDNVRFSYPGTVTPALDSVSFVVPQGTILGVMGRSGSGKTTITRILQALHSRYGGLVKIDGIDIRQFDIDHLRRHIGVVLQENFLFRGSIRDNIRGARADATLEQIVRAAQLAGAEEFIERMPRGYDTIIEEGAANLSGGQRQRLAIARALIVDPPILILDEATSALDAESEAIVNANLLQIARGRTVVIISHRLSVLIPAHQIIVMERGKVEDSGTHDELVQRCEIYRSLWFQQNGHILKSTRPGGVVVTPLRQ